MKGIEVRNVSKSFGGLQVLDKVSISAAAGRVTALIGPNGAGKSTLANIINGFTAADLGEVLFNGDNVSKEHNSKRAGRGLARTFQNLELFKGETVQGNVLLGGYRHVNKWLRWAIFPSTKEMERVQEILTELDLHQQRIQDVSALSFGQAKIVELGRVVAINASAIVMDEPAAGLTAAQTEEIGEWIKGTAASGTAVLLIEHNMRIIMDIADYIYVLDGGKLIAEGSPSEIMVNQAVLDAYLGTD
jgi:branched-chain amino acid transport system ATP-binding protein